MIETISHAATTVTGLPARVAGGGAAALVIAVTAYRTRSLSRDGGVAAVACGAASAAAGWGWAVLLVVYFVASSIVSAVGRARKEARTAPIAEKGGERDAAQVVANGGAYCIAALATLALAADSPWRMACACGAVGALAGSAADTWSTEIGVLWGGAPWSIITRTVVPTGESGGVTWGGTLGSAAGAALVAGVAALLGLVRGAALAPFVAGMLGSLLDSVLGATVQSRRRCEVCDTRTERHVHTCGAETRHVGGVRWVDNDVVNFAATVGGFLTAFALTAWWTHG